MSNAMRMGALASLLITLLAGSAATARADCSSSQYLSPDAEDTISWDVYNDGMFRLIQGRGLWSGDANTVGVKLTADFHTESESNTPYIEGVFVCDPPGTGDYYRMRVFTWLQTDEFDDRTCFEENDTIISAYIRVCLGDPANDPW